jgi:predicted GH43/DUF377 family glycosyl hydrolase
MFVVRRDPHNPLIGPDSGEPWREHAAFNPSVVRDGQVVRMYFRALSSPPAVIAPFETGSTIGMAISQDLGMTFGAPSQALRPQEPWEAFGMEDPRAVVIEGKTYLTYTALGGYPYGAENIKAAIAVSDDGVNFTERHLMTPFNAKAFALFPQKVGGKYVGFLTVHTDFTPEHPRPVIALARADRIEDFWNSEYWDQWYANLDQHVVEHLRRSDEDHMEVGASPIYTEDGWLLIYSYISHYYDESRRSFGIEALLLDLEDPTKLVARTAPFLTPEEGYEREGTIPNIVFPSSAVIADEDVVVYYGGADTVCARASIRLKDLLDTLTGRAPAFVRASDNPMLEPIGENPFESRLVFNPAAIDHDGTVHILYRAMDEANTSTVGYASSKDGIHVESRLPVPVYGPRADFELKLGSPTGNSGCEDPRLSVIDGVVYITYTAYDGVSFPRGAMSSIPLADFIAHRFENWSEPKLMTPDDVDDKDVALLPGTVDGKYVLYHRVNGRICADRLDDLEFKERARQCIDIFGARPGMWDGEKVGIAAPPIKVAGGWLMLYHGVSEQRAYRVGAALLAEDGVTLLARSADPMLEPITEWERVGEIPDVVFPCGAVVRGDTVYLYYGGADTVVGVATASLSAIVAALS